MCEHWEALSQYLAWLLDLGQVLVLICSWPTLSLLASPCRYTLVLFWMHTAPFLMTLLLTIQSVGPMETCPS